MAKNLIRMFTVWTGDCPTTGCAFHLKPAGGASITRREVLALTRNISPRRTKPATIYCDGYTSFRHHKLGYVSLHGKVKELASRHFYEMPMAAAIFARCCTGSQWGGFFLAARWPEIPLPHWFRSIAARQRNVSRPGTIG